MPKRALFLSTIAIFSRFNLPFMHWFQNQGWQVDYVSDGEIQIPGCDNQYTISIKRNPFSIMNLKAYKQLKNILLKNDYDIIHCHTPMGGVLGRLIAKYNKIRAKIIYTAHGFHFFEGASIVNWLVYYPVEKYLAQYCNSIITINEEDFNIAKNNFTKKTAIFKIDGVGVNLHKFHPYSADQKIKLREKMGYMKDDFIILYVAEFTKRKNHILLINNIGYLQEGIKQLKIIFVGNGPLFEKYQEIIKKTEIVDFLGYRNDINELCNIADIAVSPSKQEGLPIGVIEAMASGLPLVCSKIRGHTDVINHLYNGLLFDLRNPREMVDSILALYNDTNLRNKISEYNIKDARKYSIDIAIKNMEAIYQQFMC